MKNIFIALALAASIYGILAMQAQEPPHPERYSLHQVQPGESLWSISEKYLPGIDPRVGVQWICEANGLQGAIIYPGDVLNVPCIDGPLAEPLGPEYSSIEAAIAAEQELQKLLKGGCE